MEKIHGDPEANHFVSSTLKTFSLYPWRTYSAPVSNMIRDALEQLICILFVQKVQFQTYKCHLRQYVKSVAVATTREQVSMVVHGKL